MAEILGVKSCTRTYALAAIWEYIKMNDLQDKDSKDMINCDENFRKVKYFIFFNKFKKKIIKNYVF